MKMRRVCSVLAVIAGVIVSFMLIIGYLSLRSLERQLAGRVSAMATDFLGQPVSIKGITIDFRGFCMDGLTVANPSGFPEGNLFEMKRLCSDIDARALMSGTLSMGEVTIDSPRITLARTADGRFNLSEQMIRLLTRKGTIRYRIGRIRVRNGAFSAEPWKAAAIASVSADLRNLSSEEGTKTMVSASAEAFGGTSLAINGWAFLRDETKKFRLVAGADSISFEPFRNMLGHYGIDAEAVRAAAEFTVEGDAAQGFRFGLRGSVSGMRPGFFRGRTTARISSDGKVDLPKRTVEVDSMELAAGEKSRMRLQGAVRTDGQQTAYRANLRIESFDLADIIPGAGIALAGILRSDDVRISGTLGGGMPDVAGTIFLDNASIGSSFAGADSLVSRMDFSSGTTREGRITVDGRLLRAGAVSMTVPFSAQARIWQQKRSEAFGSSATVSVPAARIDLGGNKHLELSNGKISWEGLLKDAQSTGTFSLTAGMFQYAGQTARDVAVSSRVGFGPGKASFSDLAVRSDRLKAAAASVQAKPPAAGKDGSLQLKGLQLEVPELKARLEGAGIDIKMAGTKQPAADVRIHYKTFSLGELITKNLEGELRYSKKEFALRVNSVAVAGGTASLSLSGPSPDTVFPLRVSMKSSAVAIAPLLRTAAVIGRMKIPVTVDGEITSLAVQGTLSDSTTFTGSASVAGNRLTVRTEGAPRPLLSNGNLTADLNFKGKSLAGKGNGTVGAVSTSLSISAEDPFGPGRSGEARMTIPETSLQDIRLAFWDAFPDRLLYAGLEGKVGGELSGRYEKGALRGAGTIRLHGVMIEGENGEYAVGPADGTLPISFGTASGTGPSSLPANFGKDEFKEIRTLFETTRLPEGFQTVRIGSVRYGFRIFDDVEVRIRPEDGVLNVGSIRATMFGGTLLGAARITLSPDFSYRLGYLVDGMSLSRLCDEIEPIRGYISGRISGIGLIKGQGAGLQNIVGRSDFWTYAEGGEKTKISREFLQKIGGPQVKAYLGDRSFDRGVMGFFLKDGFIVFHELEISNRNFFGVTDLSVKVAPLNNRISIDHLLWTITEAAYRAQKQ